MYEERLVVVKRLVLRERIHIRRVGTTERQLFEDKLRRERLVVEDPQHTGRVRELYPTTDEEPVAEDEKEESGFFEGFDDIARLSSKRTKFWLGSSFSHHSFHLLTRAGTDRREVLEVRVQTQYSDRVLEGMDVLDMDGEKIGKCGETLGDYFKVDAGFLGTTEYYVPFSAIGNVNEDQIFLNVRKDAVDSMGWRERPTTTRTTERTAETDDRIAASRGGAPGAQDAR